MYKTRINKKKLKIIIIVGALVGLLRSIFFLRKEVFGGGLNQVGELLQGLINVIESNEPVDNMFKGNALVQNVYRKSLDAQKRRITENISTTSDKFQAINSNIYIDKTDLTNILYNNTAIYRLMKFSCKNCFVSEKDINKSYQKVLKILSGAKILTDSNDNKTNRARVDTWITSQYFLIADSNDYTQEISSSNKGEDLFMNGIEEDSDYDLQIDIENIGKLLFESFIAPTEIIFYKMPQVKYKTPSNNKLNQELNATMKGILDLVNTGSKGIDTEIAAQENQTPTNPPQTTVESTQTTTTTTTTTTTANEVINADTSLQTFKESNSQQSTTNQLQPIQGDDCRVGISAGPGPETVGTAPNQQGTASPEAMQEYVQAVEEQINNYQNLNPENDIISNVGNAALNNMTPEQKNVFIEKYTNKLLEDSNVESCLQKCSDLPVADRIVCQIKCLCFTMVWPNSSDSKFESMNEMLKLRFCMVPAKSMAIPKGKNIYSLEDIYTRIYTNMYNLIYNGEMVKYQRNKEFLESPIADLKLTKMISFQMNINSKPLFSNKSKLAKEDEQKNDIKKLEEITGKQKSSNNKNNKPSENLTLGTDLNKYLVIQDTIKDKVYKEYSASATEYEIKYAQAKALEDGKSRNAQTVKNMNIPVITDKKNEVMSTISAFLASNFTFRQTTELELQNINNVILLLKSNF